MQLRRQIVCCSNLDYKGESNYIWDNQVVKMLGKELFIIIM